MFLQKSRLKMTKTIALIGLALAAAACNKGGGTFSVLTDSSQFKQGGAGFTNRKLDVLFVVDNSGSMATSQENLANNFTSFINKFMTKGYDFRIAVTTSDAFYGSQFVNNGCSICKVEQTRFRSGTNPKIYVLESSKYNLSLPSEMTRLKNDFTANIKVGVNGSGDERAFSSFEAALSSELNVGFHRPGAYLAVVIVSDEEDFSQLDYNRNESYSNPKLFPVANYKSYLETFTGGIAGEDFQVSSIAVFDEACRSSLAGSSGAQKVGVRYGQLADITGGSKNSICSNFDTSLDNISTQIITQSRPVYTLDKKPIVSSIQVIVDGVSVPQSSTDGWSYDAAANTITINGTTYKPNVGSDIVINFDPDLS